MGIRNNEGSLIIHGAMMLGGLSVLILMLEIGNLFLTKARLQRAVDAAAVAAGTQLFAGGNAAAVEHLAEQLVNYNMLEMGFTTSTAVAQYSLSPNNDAALLKVTGTVNTNTFILGMILPSSVLIRAEAETKRPPIILSLVLDLSGSMNSGNKLSDLKTAAKSLVGELSEQIDRISLISFSTNAKVVNPMNPVDKTALYSAIDSLNAVGGTNISDGIVTGKNQIASSGAAIPDAVKAMILVTDGDPTSFRARFLSPKNTSTFPVTVNGYRDYYLTFLPDLRAAWTKAPNATTAPSCSTSYSASSIKNCLNNYKYLDSSDRQRGTSITDLTSTNPAFQRENYDLSIVEADAARDLNIRIYTVGIGNLAPASNDPYQNIMDQTNIKSYFLRRIANDPVGAADPPFPGLPYPNTRPAGKYLQTPDSSQLKGLFAQILQRIKVRLVN